MLGHLVEQYISGYFTEEKYICVIEVIEFDTLLFARLVNNSFEDN